MKRLAIVLSMMAAVPIVSATHAQSSGSYAGEWKLDSAASTPWASGGTLTVTPASQGQVANYDNHGPTAEPKCLGTDDPPSHPSVSAWYLVSYDWNGGGTMGGCVSDRTAGQLHFFGKSENVSGYLGRAGVGRGGGCWTDNPRAGCLGFTAHAPAAEEPAETTKTSPAPEAGKAKTYPVPPPGKRANIFDGTLGVVDDDGDPVDAPFGAAFSAYAPRADELCWIFLVVPSGDSYKPYLYPTERFADCLIAVYKILLRYDKLHPQQGQNARAAAGRRCVFVGNPAARKLLRFTCKATPTGARIMVRPKKPGAKLSRLLRGKKERLVVRRSSHDTSGRASVKARWR